MWDIGGQDKLRPLWRHYFDGVDAVIFVVDSNDRERVKLAGRELRKMVETPELSDCCLLVFANKQDLQNSMKSAELLEQLELKGLRNRYYVQPCTATSGAGLYEGLDWLADALASKSRKASFR